MQKILRHKGLEIRKINQRADFTYFMTVRDLD